MIDQCENLKHSHQYISMYSYSRQERSNDEARGEPCIDNALLCYHKKSFSTVNFLSLFACEVLHFEAMFLKMKRESGQ